MELLQAFDVYRMIEQCCNARGGVAGLSLEQRDSFARAMREVQEVFVIAGDTERSRAEAVEAITAADIYRAMDQALYGHSHTRPALDVFLEFSDICAFIAENLEQGTDWLDDEEGGAPDQPEDSESLPEPTCKGSILEPPDDDQEGTSPSERTQ